MSDCQMRTASKTLPPPDQATGIFWWPIVATLALVGLSACVSEPDGTGHLCPPNYEYDSDSQSCISTIGDGSDAGTNDDYDTDGSQDTNSTTDGDTSGDSGTGEHDSDDGPDTNGDPCDNINCGYNASCEHGDCHCDEGYDGDPYEQCYLPPPCDGGCPYGATCLDDQCVCDPGFTAVADSCERDEVSDPASRSQVEVCQRWNEDPWTITFDKWEQEPVDECDWGRLSEEYHLEAIREVTRYRWLVGLPAVTNSESARVITQACATTLAAEGAGLTHQIPETYACYTSEAASGAGSSNLVMGASPAAATVRVYIEDWNVPTMGHRRWLFNPNLGATAFGMRGSYSCQFVFDGSGSASPEYTAYPAPGYFPKAALHGKWSLASHTLSLGPETEIEIVRLDDGEPISIHDFRHHPAGGGYGRPAMVSWRLTVAPQTGESFRVTIVDAYSDGSDLVYEVTLVDC